MENKKIGFIKKIIGKDLIRYFILIYWTLFWLLNIVDKVIGGAHFLFVGKDRFAQIERFFASLGLGDPIIANIAVDALTSGDAITISDEGCKNEKGEWVLKFSKMFLDRLLEIKGSGFELKEAKVNFIVYWTDDVKKSEVKIVLPELHFENKQVKWAN